MVLSPSLFSVSDFDAVRVWDRSETLAYSFGFTVPADLGAEFQHVVNELLTADTHSHMEGAWTLANDHDITGKLQQCLRLLVDHRCARCLTQDLSKSQWVLTEHGKGSLQAGVELVNARRYLVPREAVPLREQSVYELVWRMHKASWICSVKARQSKTNNNHSEDYVHTGDVA